MAIFSPIDTMGPAHRGAQIQQMAQNAAQNVLRRQKLRAMLQSTSAAAAGLTGHPGAGSSFGASVPFRGSFLGHSIGVLGATFRPGGAQHGTATLSVPGAGGGFGHYPDPGPEDLGSLPAAPGADPRQSPASTQNSNGIIPGSWQDPNRQIGTQAIDPSTGQPSGAWWVAANPADPTGSPPVLGTQGGTPYHDTPVTPTATGVEISPSPASGSNVGVAAAGLIPLGSGAFYNPATDQIHTPGRQL